MKKTKIRLQLLPVIMCMVALLISIYDGINVKAATTDTQDKLATPKITSIKKAEYGFTVKWTKVKEANGYEIKCCKNKEFKKCKDGYFNHVTPLTVELADGDVSYKHIMIGLFCENKEINYIKMRAYKYADDGKKIYSPYSGVKKFHYRQSENLIFGDKSYKKADEKEQKNRKGNLKIESDDFYVLHGSDSVGANFNVLFAGDDFYYAKTKSSNNKIFKVAKDNQLILNKEGKAKLIATYKNKRAEKTIEIINPKIYAKKISINKSKETFILKIQNDSKQDVVVDLKTVKAIASGNASSDDYAFATYNYDIYPYDESLDKVTIKAGSNEEIKFHYFDTDELYSGKHRVTIKDAEIFFDFTYKGYQLHAGDSWDAKYMNVFNPDVHDYYDGDTLLI